MTKNTRITLSLGLILASSTLHADTLPALGSKGGGVLLPEGKSPRLNLLNNDTNCNIFYRKNYMLEAS